MKYFLLFSIVIAFTGCTHMDSTHAERGVAQAASDRHNITTLYAAREASMMVNPKELSDSEHGKWAKAIYKVSLAINKYKGNYQGPITNPDLIEYQKAEAENTVYVGSLSPKPSKSQIDAFREKSDALQALALKALYSVSDSLDEE